MIYIKKTCLFLVFLLFSLIPFNVGSVDVIDVKPVVSIKDYNPKPVMLLNDSQVFYLDLVVKKDVKNSVSLSVLDGYVGAVTDNVGLEGFPLKSVSKVLLSEDKFSYVFRYIITTGFFVNGFDFIPKIGSFEYPEFAWFNSSWGYRIKYTINQNYIDNDLLNFPVLVKVNSSVGAMCDGGDSIRMIAMDNVTVMDYEIESGSGNTYNVWVRIPRVDSLNSNLNDFWFYYNNSGAVDGQDAVNVWDSSYKMVQHLHQSTALSVDDSTNNNNDVTGSGGTPQYQQTGKIGYGINLLNHSSEYLSISDSASLDISSSITISGWVYIKGLPTTAGGYILAKFDASANKRAYDIWFYESDDRFYGYVYEVGTTAGEYSRCADPISKNVWVYVTWNVPTGNDKVAVFYINGVDQTPYAIVTSTADSIYVSDRPLYIGCSETGGVPTNFFNGTVDELRLSNIQRNASWIKAEYHSTNYTSGFLIMGGVQYPPMPPSSLLAVAYNCSQINLSWVKNSDITRVQKNSSSWHSYPTSITNGSNLYNGTGLSVVDTGLNENTTYFYSAWSYNTTWRIWSQIYSFVNETTPSCRVPPNVCPTSNISDYLNFTITFCAMLNDTSGTFDYNISCNNSQYVFGSGVSNGTYCINLTLLWGVNYTINVSVWDDECWTNKTEYINISKYCIGGCNMTDVVINLDMGLLFVLVLLTGWLFFTSLYFARRQIILGFVQFCFAMPLTFVVGSLSVGYVLGYAVTFIIPMLSLIILADAFYGRRKPR